MTRLNPRTGDPPEPLPPANPDLIGSEYGPLRETNPAEYRRLRAAMNPDPLYVDPYENYGIPTPPPRPSLRRWLAILATVLVIGLALGFLAGRALA